MAEYDREETEDNASFIGKAKKCIKDGCGCTLGPKGGPCSSQFLIEDVRFNLNNSLEISTGEIDLVILANIQGFFSQKLPKISSALG